MITNQQQWKQTVDMADVKRIGDLLRRKREEKRLSLEAVHAKTYLSIKYLNGLEEGALDHFPAEVYYISTLRHYSGYLGLDTVNLMEMYRAKSVKVQQEQPDRDETSKSKSMKIYFSVVLLAGLVVFGLLLRQSGQAPHDALAAPQHAMMVSTTASVPASVSTQAIVPSALPIVSSRTAIVPLTGHGKLKLSVKITETSWVKVLADSEILFEGTLLTGSEKEWAARERFNLVVGYAPGVRATLNGTPIDVTKGARQDINQLVLTGDDAKTQG